MPFKAKFELIPEGWREYTIHVLFKLFIRIFKVSNILHNSILILTLNLELLAHIHYLFDAIQLSSANLAVTNDDIDDSISEVHEDDHDCQHHKVYIKHRDVVFRCGYAIPTGLCSLHSPI